MEKIIPFKKEIIFKQNIEDILSISLDKNLEIIDQSIKGLFVISGEYNTYENNKDVFNIEIPYIEFLGDSYNTSNAYADIDDFYYEVSGKNKIDIHIDIKVDNLEENIVDNRTINTVEEDDFRISPSPSEIEDTIISNEVEESDIMNENNTEINNNIVDNKTSEIKEKTYKDCFETDSSGKDKLDVEEVDDIKPTTTSILDIGPIGTGTESFITYKVYIVREGDTLESILENYNITRERLAQYNNLNDIKIGDKLIIPNEKA